MKKIGCISYCRINTFAVLTKRPRNRSGEVAQKFIQGSLPDLFRHPFKSQAIFLSNRDLPQKKPTLSDNLNAPKKSKFLILN